MQAAEGCGDDGRGLERSTRSIHAARRRFRGPSGKQFLFDERASIERETNRQHLELRRRLHRPKAWKRRSPFLVGRFPDLLAAMHRSLGAPPVTRLRIADLTPRSLGENARAQQGEAGGAVEAKCCAVAGEG